MASELFAGLHDKKKPKVEFYLDNKQAGGQEWRWRLWLSSDIVAASSEGYSSKAEARENFLKIEKHIQYLRENDMLG
jgi:uncharacterized protein YegP (UPF0339 family)